METQSIVVNQALAAVTRITSSSSFARAGSQCRLLRYLVEKAAAGEAAGLKESTIAADVFHRQSYDPQVDSLVRVEAAKLRSRLAKYYAADGKHDPVRIEIPKGTYIPVFSPNAGQAGAAKRRFFSNWWAAALALAAAASIVAFRSWRHSNPPLWPGPPSIAVLPFADMTPGKEFQYLCDGLTEEVISALGQLEGMRVASRTSVMQYRGRPTDTRRIGVELGVHAVLEGSVRIEGQRLRVAAQLISTGDGFHLWSTALERDLRDAILLQKEIAASISKAFRLDLTRTSNALVRPRPHNSQAWHFYMRGVYREGSGEPANAVEFYRSAVAADPGYAMAWAALSRALSQAVDWEEMRPLDALPEAARAARRALSIDGGLPEAQQALGLVKIFYERDWPGAEAAFRRAIQALPSTVGARYDYARLVLTTSKRYMEAIDELNRAISLDPTDNSPRNELAGVFIKAGRYQEARHPLEVSLRLAPGAPTVHMLTGQIAEAEGKTEEALRAFEKAASVRRGAWILAHAARVQERLGRRPQAERLLAEIEKMGPVRPNYEIAQVLAALNLREQAIAALESAQASLSPRLIWIQVDHALDPLRNEPRFQRLLTHFRFGRPL